jgi:tetratricopeptide (TPR) repeat protein
MGYRINRSIRYLVLSLLLLLSAGNASSSWAQVQLELPTLSQKASVMQRIGLLDVNINYSRPNVKERTIWGDLVPFGQVWRTGADEATTIFFSEDVNLNGNKVLAGKYALFTIPRKDEWTIVINKVAKQWGAFNYDSTKDVVRFNVKPEENNFTESLEFAFENITTKSADIQMKWEKLKVSFTVNFDLDAKAYSNIKKAIESAQKDDWVVYAASANYAVDNNIHKDEAMKWVDKSIQIKPTFYNYFVKAKLLANEGRSKEAINFLEKSKQEGKNDSEYIRTYSSQVNKMIHDLKAKKK